MVTHRFCRYSLRVQVMVPLASLVGESDKEIVDCWSPVLVRAGSVMSWFGRFAISGSTSREFTRFVPSPFCLVLQTKLNMDVCWVNRAVKGNFLLFARTFAEGAWAQVPKTHRTFGIFWRHHFGLVHHENSPLSLFDLNLPYCFFKLFLFQSPTTFFHPSSSATSTLITTLFLAQILPSTSAR